MTNYEKVKQMSIDEMAYTLMCPYDADGDTCVDNCIECTRQWLEKEAEE